MTEHSIMGSQVGFSAMTDLPILAPTDPLPMSADQGLWLLAAIVLVALLALVEWPG